MGVLSNSINNKAGTIQAPGSPVASSQPRPASNLIFPTASQAPTQAPKSGGFLTQGLLDKLKSIGNFIAPQTTKIFTGEAAQELSQSQSKRITQKGDFFGAVKNAGLDTLDLLKTAGKAGLEVGSYMVPFGRAGFIGSKFVIPGLASGVLRAASSDKPTLSGVATEGITGAVTSGAFQGLGKLASKGIEQFGPKIAEKIPGLSTAMNFAKKTGTGTSLIPTNKLAPTEEFVQKKINPIRQFYDRARNIIASQGEVGKGIADDLVKWRDVAERSAGLWVDRLKPVRELNKKEFEIFVDYAEGRVPPNTLPANPKLQNALGAWDSVRKEIVDIADGIGLKIGARENYFPHIFDPNMFKGQNFQKAADHLVETGQAATRGEAANILRAMANRIKGSKYGNLEFEREVNLPGYRKDLGALMDYVENAANRLSEVAAFGKNYEKVYPRLEQLASQGYDAGTVEDLFLKSVGANTSKQVFGATGSLARGISGGVRAYQTTTRLGLGALTNVAQSINTATSVGILRTLRNIPGALTQEKRDFALRSGVTLHGVLQDLAEGGGFSNSVLGKKITAPGFNAVEKFNRTLAAWAGKEFADDLGVQAAKGSKQAVRQLEKLGLNSASIIQNGGKLTQEEQITAARRIVERTQFKVDPQDLPGWASSPWGRIIAQFRTFSYNQTAFIKREIVDEAFKGNFMPAIRFAVAAPLVGGGIKELRNLITFQPSEENPVKRVSQYYGQAGGTGILEDVQRGFFPQNEQYIPKDRAVSLAVGALGGPTASFAAEGVGALSEARQGKFKAGGRFLTKQIPIVGTPLANVLFPYKEKKQTKTRTLAPLPSLR